MPDRQGLHNAHFFYILNKLHVKLCEAVLSAQLPDFKADANGYCHMYFHTTGIDTLMLLTFLTDDDIQDAVQQQWRNARVILCHWKLI